MNKCLLMHKDERGIYAPTRFGMCVVVAAIFALLAGILVNKGFSPAEGWYSYYAYMINEEGAVPYVDFELLFPPLYTYLIAAFTRIFGYGIMALRVFGVLIFVATGVFAALIFDKLTDNTWFGLLGGLLAVSVLQSEVVQVFYDYIRLMDLHVYIAVYFFLRFFARLDRGEGGGRIIDADILIGSMFAVLASMYKQSSGLIFLLFCYAVLLFLLIVLPHKKMFVKGLVTSLAVGILLYGAMFLFLLSQGALSQYFYYNFQASVSAKGGTFLGMLFGWIGRDTLPLIVGVLGAAGLFAGAWWLRGYAERHPDAGWRPTKKQKILFCCMAGGVAVTLIVAVGVWYEQLQYFFFHVPQLMTVFMFAVCFFAAMGFGYIFQWKWVPVKKEAYARYFFMGGTVAILGFAVCTSGGVSESQLALGYPFMAAVALPWLGFHKKQIAAGVLAVLMIFHSGIAWSRKYAQIYSWWGLKIGSVAEQTETAEAPILAGLTMEQTYAAMYDAVYHAAQTYTTQEDKIFAFPHMPIIYLMTDRPRATKTAIQWFDVSTDEAVIADIDVLRNAPPKMMVLSTVPDYAVEAHERSFRDGTKSGLGVMWTFLEEFVITAGYTSVGTYTVSEGYTVTIYVLP